MCDTTEDRGKQTRHQALISVLVAILIAACSVASASDEVSSCVTERSYYCPKGVPGKHNCIEYKNECSHKAVFTVDYGFTQKRYSLDPRSESHTSSLTVYCEKACGRLVGVDRFADPDLSENWIAEGIAGDYTALEKGGRDIGAGEMRVGDVLVSRVEMPVFFQAGYGKGPEFILDKGRAFVIQKILDRNSSGFFRQFAVQIEMLPQEVPAAAPLRVAVTTGAVVSTETTLAPDETAHTLGSGGDHESGIWWEHPVAEATAGYDAPHNRTLINSYDLVVFGPSSVGKTIEKIVEGCVQSSAFAAFSAFKATPSPEVGARVGAAWTSFQAAIRVCLTAKNIADDLKGQFDIGYIQRARWADGLNLKFSADYSSADQYKKLHGLVKGKLPAPLNQLVTFYISTQEVPSVDIRVDPPKFVQDALKALPSPEQLKQMSDAIDYFSKKKGKEIVEDMKADLQKEAAALGAQATSEAQKIVTQQVRLVGDAASQLATAAPDLVNTVLNSGGIRITVPKIVPDLSGHCLEGCDPLTGCHKICT